MTSLGVNVYVRGVLQMRALRAEDVRIFQTGGPSGDLGSNNILLNQASKVTAIVDGSGALYDPAGLERDELVPRR